MEFGRLWALRGPNVWARVPVLEVEVEAGEPLAWPADFGVRLVDQLSTLRGGNHEVPTALKPSLEYQAGFQSGSLKEWASELRHAPTPVHALQLVTLELQCLTGCNVAFGTVRGDPRPGWWRVAVEYEEEPLGRACLESARGLCLTALQDRPFDLAAEVRKLRELAYDVRLGPSTAAIVRAARRRGIPVRRLNDASLVQLGRGAHARRICAAETDRTGIIAEAIAQDKDLTRTLLRAVGVPVPDGRTVSDADDAWEAADDIGLPVVVKPRDGNHGRGVATNLTTREAVDSAFAAARDESSQVMVERFIPGVDYRLLVIGGRLVAAALEPAQVTGDGRSSINQLIAEVNRDPRRSDGHATVLSYIKIDPVALGVLAEQGFTPESVPPAGTRVLIRRNANLSTGGTATDVTDRVHPDVAARAVDAARAVGLDVAGVDVVTPDVGRPLEEVGGAVVEINAGPGLRMHLEPSAGRPRPVGEAIVEMLFPLSPTPLSRGERGWAEGQSGRILIAAVTGVNGKTTTTRLLTHLLRQAGCFVGMTCTDGTYLDGRRSETRDCSGPRSARSVLLHPRVEVAVFETARGGILREGLGFEECDVAVVTNVGVGDHLGLRSISTPQELALVKRTVVEAVSPGGAAVLNAADPLVAAMAGHCAGAVIFFARDAGLPVLAGHRRAGGRAVFTRGGCIVLGDGESEETLAPLERVPLTHGGKVGFQVENALAATAAAWALGLPLDTIRAGLESFVGDARQSPGRYNVFRFETRPGVPGRVSKRFVEGVGEAGGATVVVDFAHNASALAALVESLDAFPHSRRTAVFAAFDRRDADVVAVGEVLGRAFDRVVLVTDRGDRERADGELNALLRQGLARGPRVMEIKEAGSEFQAAVDVLRSLLPDDLVVLGVKAIKEVLAFTESLLPGGGVAPEGVCSRR